MVRVHFLPVTDLGQLRETEARPIQLCVAEFGCSQIRARERAALKLGTQEKRRVQRAAVELSTMKLCSVEHDERPVRPVETAPPQEGLSKVSSIDVCTHQLDRVKTSFCKLEVTEVSAIQVRSGQIDLLQDDHGIELYAVKVPQKRERGFNLRSVSSSRVQQVSFLITWLQRHGPSRLTRDQEHHTVENQIDAFSFLPDQRRERLDGLESFRCFGY